MNANWALDITVAWGCMCKTACCLKPFLEKSKLQPTRCNVSKFIYFYRRSTCFRQFLRPSSGAYNCTYSFRFCQPILLLATTVVAASSSICWQYLKPVCTVMCSWWWAEETPETCRASVKINKPRNVASCWLQFGIILRCTDIWMSQSFRETSQKWNFWFLFLARQPPLPVGQGLLIHEVSRLYTTTHYSR